MRNIPFRSDSVISPSSSTFSSLLLRASSSRERDSGGLGALLPLPRLEGNLRSLGQALVPAAGDLAVVDEQVLAALVRLDEPVALLIVEPLHRSGCHETPPSLLSRTSQEGEARNHRTSKSRRRV